MKNYLRGSPHGSHHPRAAADTVCPIRAVGPARGADQLLAEARELRSQRSARTLTPGAGAPIKQTLLALVAGQSLEEHAAPGPTTLQAVTGHVVLHHGDHTVELSEGSWATCPASQHTLEARSDSVVLLTVAHTPTS